MSLQCYMRLCCECHHLPSCPDEPPVADSWTTIASTSDADEWVYIAVYPVDAGKMP